MNEIINWIAQYNTLVIQVAFSIVLLLILIYVYRLFFVNSGSSGSIESSTELGELNQKLAQLLEGQKASGIQVIEKVVPAVAAVGGASDAVSEIEQLKAENAKLRTQLNESEKKVFELTPIAGPEDSLKDDEPKIDPAQVVELNKKIEELQSRLSEYDIIADDIAELGQLRAENADLKRKMQEGGGDEVEGRENEAREKSESSDSEKNNSEASSSENSKNENSSSENNQSDWPASENVNENSNNVASTAVTEVAASGGVPGFDVETSALLDSLVAETDAAAAKASENTEPVADVASEVQGEADAFTESTTEQGVSENEKNLINEFEKTIRKGS